MKKTIITTTIAALLATSALSATAEDKGLNLGLNLDTDIGVESDLLTAQTDAGVGVDAGVDVSEDGVNVDAGVGADVDANVDDTLDANANANASADANASNDMAGEQADDTYGSVMASINTVADFDFSAVSDDTEITIVTLSSLVGNAETESAALDAALSADVEAQVTLHNRIEANAAIMAELEAEGYTSEDVVSLKSKADGAIVVYVDDRA